jgi:hypothetical protein
MDEKLHFLTTTTLLLGATLGFAASRMQAQTRSDSERVQESSRVVAEGQAAAKKEVTIAPADSVRFPDRWYPSNGRAMAIAPITGVPYSAVEVITYRDKTPDGVIAHEQRTVKMRDSAGRERTESISGGGSVGGVAFKTRSVQVSDRVSHCAFHWSAREASGDLPPQEKLALVDCGARTWTTIAFDVQAVNLRQIELLAPGTDSERLKLVKGVIDGMEYVGESVFHVPQANEDFVPWGLETWFSPELHVQLRQFRVDQNGVKVSTETESSLTDIKREEPDAALFYPPDTYTILTNDEFNIHTQELLKAQQ